MWRWQRLAEHLMLCHMAHKARDTERVPCLEQIAWLCPMEKEAEPS